MKFIALNLLIFVCTQVLARGGDEILNGGGVAEQNFTLAWLRLGPTLEICAKVGCAKSANEVVLLRTLTAQMQNPQPPLIFASRRTNGSIFKTVGWSNVIAGGSGSVLTVDIDSIYSGGQATSLSQAVSELAVASIERLVGSRADLRPDAVHLAVALSQLANERIHARDMASIGQPQVRALLWDFSPFPSRLSIADQDGEADLTSLVQTNLVCPSGEPASAGFILSGLAWEPAFDWDAQSLNQPLDLSASIQYRCGAQLLKGHIEMIPRYVPVDTSGAKAARGDWIDVPGLHLKYIQSSTQVSIVDLTVEGNRP